MRVGDLFRVDGAGVEQGKEGKWLKSAIVSGLQSVDSLRTLETYLLCWSYFCRIKSEGFWFSIVQQLKLLVFEFNLCGSQFYALARRRYFAVDHHGWSPQIKRLPRFQRSS